METAPCLIECSDKIDIFIGKIACTVRMFRHGEMLLLPHARRIMRHRNRTRRGNCRFRSTLCSAFDLASFPLGRTSVLGLELGTRLPFVVWTKDEITPLSLPSIRTWLFFRLLPCAAAFTSCLASSFDTNSATSFCLMLLPSFASSALGAINFQFQNNSGFITFQTEGKSQCSLKTSAGFFLPAMWWMLMMPAATACRTRWWDKATQRLCILEWGMAAELITDSLSPSIVVGPLIGAPRHRSARRKSMICSVHVLAATHSEPNVAVSTVDCDLECQSTGVLLSWWRMPATDSPLMRSWCRLASKNDVTVPGFPFGAGAPKGISSFASAQQECSHSHSVYKAHCGLRRYIR